MMFKKHFTVLFFFLIVGLCAQNVITGHINLQNGADGAQRVYLAKLDIDHLENLRYAHPIAWSPIQSDGSFTFDRKHIADKNSVYHLYVNRLEKAISDTISSGASFILASTDTIRFASTNSLFDQYTTTNLADKEWKKFQEFESQLDDSQIDEQQEATQMKSYAKDSLRILIVKLIGIKLLDDKHLLEQDITKNPTYYLALLEELKRSEIPTEQYHFLKKKLAYLTQDVIVQKYAWSRLLNLFLGFLTLGLGFLMVYRRRKRRVLPDLSKQERTIQALILEGKTNKEIANELFISHSTVKTHITHIYGKLNVSSRDALQRLYQNS